MFYLPTLRLYSLHKVNFYCKITFIAFYLLIKFIIVLTFFSRFGFDIIKLGVLAL